MPARSEPAPAKLNLFLRVVGRRPDGFHELDSMFIPLPLCDRIAVELRSAPSSSVYLRCDHSGLGPTSDNLATRAAIAFMREFALSAEITIDLRKIIPAGAGLGGGSSDAAAVLRILAGLCDIHDPARLTRVALALGADVPYFLDPRPARVGGIGERIVPLNAFAPLDLLVAVPPVNVSTAAIFRRLTPSQWSGPAPDAAIDAVTAGRATSALLVNDLASTATALHPEIGALQTALEQLGASASAMTGSGGAVFGIFRAAYAVAEAARRLRALHPNARIIGCNSAGPPGAFTEF